jgi:hypothetical protein
LHFKLTNFDRKSVLLLLICMQSIYAIIKMFSEKTYFLALLGKLLKWIFYTIIIKQRKLEKCFSPRKNWKHLAVISILEFRIWPSMLEKESSKEVTTIEWLYNFDVIKSWDEDADDQPKFIGVAELANLKQLKSKIKDLILFKLYPVWKPCPIKTHCLKH